MSCSVDVIRGCVYQPILTLRSQPPRLSHVFFRRGYSRSHVLGVNLKLSPHNSSVEPQLKSGEIIVTLFDAKKDSYRSNERGVKNARNCHSQFIMLNVHCANALSSVNKFVCVV